MLVSFNDPQSIVRWWRIWPERHTIELQAIAPMYPQFAPQIREAWALINNEQSR